ncbi:hydroxymethylbilane synthase [Salsuginibacillus halophilus]|uniref:Porphobilinogen deaminase n=1 Tax=Salsuginibacillus halophilus TaxID=517424 RepID=A0A2P8HCQ9_9BACI|nr:hydroxymethylbilane synthase [Salsuginibacillus halophilus]PSL43998.1 hydroxymethylbilane synthase [Salsuginibacillus halophilus]
MDKIVVGTRKSNLALKQAEWVIERLQAAELPYTFEMEKIVTKGDQILDVTLNKVGGKGLFVKEIEKALEDGVIDMAVHSMKDVPSALEEPFEIGAITEREDPRDVLISNGHVPFHELPAGAVVGTSSLRRSAQILAERPDVTVHWVRGNIETRLRKLREEGFDAIVLAAAGLQRMGWTNDIVTEFLDPEMCIPAVGQGALGIEIRKGDERMQDVLKHLHHEEVAKRVTAERAFLHAVEGGCQVPIGGFANLEADGQVTLNAVVGEPDGTKLLKETETGYDAEAVGKAVAERIAEAGGTAIIERVKAELNEG